jgi:high affinity sulfate transporter 1
MLRLGGRSTISQEVFAGITLAALAIPLNIGYAESAGLPVIVGINAAVLPLLVFAVVSGSRHLVVGPDATIAALLAAVLPTVAASSGASPEELALALALLTGVILIGLWAVRAGSFVRFISKSVLVGFLAGLGIEILTSQVEKILNVEVSTGEWITDVIDIVEQIPDASWASVVVGVGTIVILRLCGRFAPKLPAPLIALVLVGGAVAVFTPEGVELLGEIPSGLPSLSFPPKLDFETWTELAGTAVAIAVLTIAEGLMIAGSAARRHHDELDTNGELFAMGAANVAAAVTSGMPIGASASRAAAVESAGSRSQVAGFVSGLLVVVVVLFLTDLVGEIPNAALAGLVANAVVSIIEVGTFRMFARLRRSEFYIALGCTAGVLVLGPIGGLVLAVLATMVDMVRRMATSPLITLEAPTFDLTTERFTSGDGGASTEDPEGVRFLRLSGPLFFANASALQEQVARAAADPGNEWVVLDFESVTDIDPTAGEAMTELLEQIEGLPTRVVLSRVSLPVRELLDRYGLLQLLGEDHLYASNREALAAFRATRPTTT